MAQGKRSCDPAERNEMKRLRADFEEAPPKREIGAVSSAEGATDANVAPGIGAVSHASQACHHQPTNEKYVELYGAEVDALICRLALQPDIQVAKDYSNTRNTDVRVQAYAKLAGCSWTYYVQQLHVSIGRRATEVEERVDIDLGPAKIISRQHASIDYNVEARYWQITVLGRNGLRIDGVSHKSGTHVLRCGTILDIGGVQMVFVLPDAPPRVALSLLPRPPAQIQLSASEEQTPVVQHVPPQSKPYPRGVTMVSRPQVHGTAHCFEQDLSSDECKDIKPPFSYATMISQAILSTPEAAMSLANIYNWISSHYSFYRHSKPGWQNSVRHNLSLNKAFEKVARKENEPGKGFKWRINPIYRDEFIRKANAGKTYKGRSGASGAGSGDSLNGPGPAAGSRPIMSSRQQQALMAGSDSHHHLATEVTAAPAGPAFGTLQLKQEDAMKPTLPDSLAQRLDISPLDGPKAKASLASLAPPPIAQVPPGPPPAVVGRGGMLDAKVLDFLDADFMSGATDRYGVSQVEAYTPERGSSSARRKPLDPPSNPNLSLHSSQNQNSNTNNNNPPPSSSPAPLWRYMHLSSTPARSAASSTKSSPPGSFRGDEVSMSKVDLAMGPNKC